MDGVAEKECNEVFIQLILNFTCISYLFPELFFLGKFEKGTENFLINQRSGQNCLINRLIFSLTRPGKRGPNIPKVSLKGFCFRAHQPISTCTEYVAPFHSLALVLFSVTSQGTGALFWASVNWCSGGWNGWFDGCGIGF